MPAFIRFLALQASRGAVEMSSPDEAAEDFLGLLMGDLQIRRLQGVLAAPGKAQIEVRAQAATEKFLRLYSA